MRVRKPQRRTKEEQAPKLYTGTRSKRRAATGTGEAPAARSHRSHEGNTPARAKPEAHRNKMNVKADAEARLLHNEARTYRISGVHRETRLRGRTNGTACWSSSER